MNPLLSIFPFLMLSNLHHLDLRYNPIQFHLSTEKESYVEGEKVTFILTISNASAEQSYPVLIPHTQNTGQKLFYFNVYDKANNTMILRATEDRYMKMMVHDTGSVKIVYLKPKEKLEFKLYWNDFENYYNYHTQNASHHSFGVPLFAGVYKVNLHYNPRGLALADSIYTYFNDWEEMIKSVKQAIPGSGEQSNICELKIRKSADTLISIEGVKYYTRWMERDGWCWYYTDSVGEGGSNPRLVHITNLPVDSFTMAKGEYFYSHFTNIYAEYIKRFDNSDIQEYRKYRDNCPEELYTEKFNDFKQKYYVAEKLPDGRFYNVTYNQPSGTKYQDMYYSSDGTLCVTNQYIYNNKGVLVDTKTTTTKPCVETLDGKSYRILEELKGK